MILAGPHEISAYDTDRATPAWAGISQPCQPLLPIASHFGIWFPSVPGPLASGHWTCGCATAGRALSWGATASLKTVVTANQS